MMGYVIRPGKVKASPILISAPIFGAKALELFFEELSWRAARDNEFIEVPGADVTENPRALNKSNPIRLYPLCTK